MLSILIPTYNYNVLPLVLEIQQQASNCKIEFEIIVLDDQSTLLFQENQQIQTIENCSFYTNNINSGRAATINKLVELSLFQYVLILEADAYPDSKTYVQTYINALKEKPEVLFGGVIYTNDRPKKHQLLRWIYGQARESKSLHARLKNPYNIVFSWNLVLDKTLFQTPFFDDSIKTYGYEDLVFLKKIKESKIIIQQIENYLIHQNEEDTKIFIEKSKKAIVNLVMLYENEILFAEDSRLLNVFEILNKMRLTGVINRIFTCFEKSIETNLQSENPSLFLFDLYRLGYFCQHIHLKK